ncbi:hypothetical protein MAHJHV55_52230 [Mycobacterium avium subsp. hominissuis]
MRYGACTYSGTLDALSASANNRVRIPSRKILQDTCDAAAEINATAVIVHGGQRVVVADV